MNVKLSRDAIFGVGKIIIETKPVVLDASYCAKHANFLPGSYLCISVSDNGCGMNKEKSIRRFPTILRRTARKPSCWLKMSR